MEDSSQSLGGFFITNFWLILVLCLAILFSYLFGFFDVFLSSFSTCSLGEGLTCIDYQFYTNERYGFSDGDEQDGINVTFKNSFSYELRDITMAFGSCRSGFQDNKLVSLMPGEQATIHILRCNEFPSNTYIKSSLIVMYDVVINASSYPIVQYGTVSGVVESRGGEKPYERIWLAIGDWIRQNIG